MRGGTEAGFTLVELMVVVLILAILAAIAVIAFTANREAAQRTTCFADERIIEGAHQQFESRNPDAPVPADYAALMTELVPASLAKAPICPAGGAYSWTTTESVVCSIHGHR
ncbi:MAG: prepilin-type N-terminal cleavage/methylation domain-containing protein [Coriobacteriia bacterium]|nr:prepilin-type N-terminal cleavage/methylation domain-containing protein [Coriobacteriia bacterium]